MHTTRFPSQYLSINTVRVQHIIGRYSYRGSFILAAGPILSSLCPSQFSILLSCPRVSKPSWSILLHHLSSSQSSENESWRKLLQWSWSGGRSNPENQETVDKFQHHYYQQLGGNLCQGNNNILWPGKLWLEPHPLIARLTNLNTQETTMRRQSWSGQTVKLKWTQIHPNVSFKCSWDISLAVQYVLYGI